MKRILLYLVALCFIVMLGTSPAAQATTNMDDELRTGDIATASADIQRSFSEFLVVNIGVLDWKLIDGVAGSDANTARMTALRAITPLAMIEGAAYDVVTYISSSGKLDMFADKSACMVGALVKGFGLKWTVHFANDEMEMLQALVYTQYDDVHLSVDAAHQKLGTITEWPIGLGSFQVGLEKGLKACGLPVSV